MTELNRISSHLLWLGTHALDIGAMTVFLYAFREREEILKIFENYCGARLTTHMFRIGGTQYEIYEGFQDQVRTFIKDFPKKVDEYETLLTENRIWIGRTRGVGVISAKDAIDIGLTGPALRGSGVKWDLRKAKPYAAYSDFEFDIPTGEMGDTYDRYMVRMEEMRQSARIVGAGRRKDSGWTAHGQAVEDHQAAGRRHLSLDRIAERRTGLLHRQRRQHDGLSRARAAAVIRESAGAATDGCRAHGGGCGRRHRNTGHRVG